MNRTDLRFVILEALLCEGEVNESSARQVQRALAHRRASKLHPSLLSASFASLHTQMNGPCANHTQVV
jgi:hypothetical protein